MRVFVYLRSIDEKEKETGSRYKYVPGGAPNAKPASSSFAGNLIVFWLQSSVLVSLSETLTCQNIKGPKTATTFSPLFFVTVFVPTAYTYSTILYRTSVHHVFKTIDK